MQQITLNQPSTTISLDELEITDKSIIVMVTEGKEVGILTKIYYEQDRYVFLCIGEKTTTGNSWDQKLETPQEAIKSRLGFGDNVYHLTSIKELAELLLTLD